MMSYFRYLLLWCLFFCFTPETFAGNEISTILERHHTFLLQEKIEENEIKSESFWKENRLVKLSPAEQQLYRNVDSLNNLKSFQRTLSWGMLLFTSFKNVGPFDVGPVEYMYSFNDLEGSRIRLGGRTSLEGSKKNYFEGYLAYGIKDESWKYYLGLTRSLNKRKVGVYPAHYIQAIYQKDVNEPGKGMGFITGNSLASSFSGRKRDKWLYNENIKFSHILEFGKNFRLETSFSRLQQSPAGELEFLLADQTNKRVPSLAVSELGMQLRWAPSEMYYQKNLRRENLSNQFPIFTFRYFAGLKGVLDGQYDYQKVDANVSFPDNIRENVSIMYNLLEKAFDKMEFIIKVHYVSEKDMEELLK